MKTICYLLVSFLTITCLNTFAQPFAIGSTSITFNDPARSGRSIPTEIYYPATSAGTNTSPATGPHCLVVFGHGFLIGYAQYQWLANTLVPNGYIVAFPDTETGFPSHGDFGDDIAFLVGAIQAEGANASSVLLGAVGTKSAIGGHSMGGGASFLAAAGNTGIDALFNFAPAETTPSAIGAASTVGVPTLVFEGTDDCVTPSAGNSGDMYTNLSTVCHSLISITGASHCQFANSDFICGLGQIGCGGNISQGAQESEVITYLLPFLDYHLKEDCDQGTIFDNLITNPIASTVQSNCNVPAATCATCANVDLDIQFDGFPSQTSWEILDANGLVVASSPTYGSSFANSIITETACLPDGCYTLNINDALGNGMCPFQSSAVGVSTFITPGTLIMPGSIIGTLSLVATPGLCGNYSLSNSAGTTLVSGGGSFGANDSQTFCLTGGMKTSGNNLNFDAPFSIEMYPNPVQDILTIQLVTSNYEAASVSIFSLNGQLQKEFTITSASKKTYNVEDLKSGFYFVEVKAGFTTEVFNLIKE